MNFIKRLFKKKKPSKCLEHILWETERDMAPERQRMEDIAWEFRIRAAAREIHRDTKPFGMIIFPVMPPYIPHHPETAKYKDGIQKAVMEEYKKLL